MVVVVQIVPVSFNIVVDEPWFSQKEIQIMLETVGDLEDQAQMVMHPIPVAKKKVVSIRFQNSETLCCEVYH